jgi:hypothetical protein
MLLELFCAVEVFGEFLADELFELVVLFVCGSAVSV